MPAGASYEPLTSYTLSDGTSLLYNGDGDVISATSAGGTSLAVLGDASPIARQFEQLFTRGVSVFAERLGGELARAGAPSAPAPVARRTLTRADVAHYATLVGLGLAAYALFTR